MEEIFVGIVGFFFFLAYSVSSTNPKEHENGYVFGCGIIEQKGVGVKWLVQYLSWVGWNVTTKKRKMVRLLIHGTSSGK